MRAAARDIDLPAVPTAVVVPHPDDEVLLAGGIIGTQARRGVEVTVIAVTDGEAAYDRGGDDALGARRRSEQADALLALGHRGPLHRLGVPDGAVAGHEAAVRDALLTRGPFGLVVAPWAHDGHPDHDACGRAAQAAAHALDVPLLGALFWAWHWSPTTALSGLDLVAVPVDADLQAARRRGIACHRTQLHADEAGDEPVLAAHHLEPLTWPAEIHVARA